jgi:hypothetical protein
MYCRAMYVSALGRERLAVLGQVQRLLVQVHQQPGPDILHVLADPGQGALSDRNDSVPVTLAVPDVDRAPSPVNIVNGQVDGLHPPHARTVEQLQDGPVAQPDRLGDVRPGQDLLHILRREDVPGNRRPRTSR